MSKLLDGALGAMNEAVRIAGVTAPLPSEAVCRRVCRRVEAGLRPAPPGVDDDDQELQRRLAEREAYEEEANERWLKSKGLW